MSRDKLGVRQVIIQHTSVLKVLKGFSVIRERPFFLVNHNINFVFRET